MPNVNIHRMICSDWPSCVLLCSNLQYLPARNTLEQDYLSQYTQSAVRTNVLTCEISGGSECVSTYLSV